MGSLREYTGDLKALGADGMPSIFYKQYWQLLGERVMKAVLDVVNGGDMSQGAQSYGQAAGEIKGFEANQLV